MLIVCGFLLVFCNCGPGIQLPVEVKTNTAECKQNKPEKEDDDKQRLFDEQSKDPPLETPTTDSPSKV